MSWNDHVLIFYNINFYSESKLKKKNEGRIIKYKLKQQKNFPLSYDKFYILRLLSLVQLNNLVFVKNVHFTSL